MGRQMAGYKKATAATQKQQNEEKEMDLKNIQEGELTDRGDQLDMWH